VFDDRAVVRSADGGSECVIRTGDVVSIHGQTGEVFAGSRPVYA
jgi:hypothetical protein